ncbi:MAG: hypothetical protein KAU36_07150, partial [candidate division Zixibacteria bacterium]|nr:hypothetical protein [candidate division Zixibacteria bacterium]
MSSDGTLFSKVLGSFVFHLMVADKVYKVECPRWGQEVTSDIHFESFSFRFLDDEPSTYIKIVLSEIVIAEERPEEHLAIGLLRAAKDTLYKGLKQAELSDTQFSRFLEDNYKDKSYDILRRDLMKYILQRFDRASDKPFFVVEIVIAMGSTVGRILKELRHLHNLKMLSFSIPAGQWPEGRNDNDWLIETFAVTADQLR